MWQPIIYILDYIFGPSWSEGEMGSDGYPEILTAPDANNLYTYTANNIPGSWGNITYEEKTQRRKVQASNMRSLSNRLKSVGKCNY